MTTLSVPRLDKRYKLHIHNHVSMLIWGAVMAHIGVLCIAAWYYGLFETTSSMNNWWHQVVPNGALRHNIRDVGEGVLGALLAKGILWNHFTKSHIKAGRIFDTLRRVYIPPALAAILSTVAIFVATFALGTYILHILEVHASSRQPAGSLWSRTATLWNSDWDKKALGFVCTFFAARPMHAIFDDIQGYFAGRRASLDRKPRFFYPKTYKNRYRFYRDNIHAVHQYPKWVDVAFRFAFLAMVLSAASGYYVLTYIA